MIELKSRRLRVYVEAPSDVLKRTVRFDSCGFVREVVLDDNICFTSTEPYSCVAGSTGGAGLCSAYEFDAFGEVGIGEQAPRPGAGLLRKKDEDGYRFSDQYECESFEHEVSIIPSASGAQLIAEDADLVLDNMEVLQFRTLSRPCAGYAFETVRSIRVYENELHMTMKLKNTGDKPVRFKEFCHNFISMDHAAIGPDWKLVLPFANCLENSLREGVAAEEYYELQKEERAVVPRQYRSDFSVFKIRKEELDTADLLHPFEWTLSHEDGRISVKGTEYYAPEEIVVWAKDHVLTPEVKYSAEVSPGSSVSWGRKWEFISRR